MKNIDIDGVSIGPNQPLAIIAGPCIAESEALCLQIGETLRDRCAVLGLGYIFKASFDKANRSSITSYRGPGLDKGLTILERIKHDLAVPVTTDIHEPGQAEPIAAVADMLQVPAFLCRQTDLLVAAASTGRPVNVKKGQFMSPAEMTNVVAKLQQAANPTGQPPPPTDTGRIMLTERGTFFGYNRLVNDFVGLGDMMQLGYPVCFDVTHSTQMPGTANQGTVTGGRPDRADLLARCAVAAGVQSLFIETHPDPPRGLSDAATMLPLRQVTDLLGHLQRLHQVVMEASS